MDYFQLRERLGGACASLGLAEALVGAGAKQKWAYNTRCKGGGLSPFPLFVNVIIPTMNHEVLLPSSRNKEEYMSDCDLRTVMWICFADFRFPVITTGGVNPSRRCWWGMLEHQSRVTNVQHLLTPCLHLPLFFKCITSCIIQTYFKPH